MSACSDASAAAAAATGRVSSTGHVIVGLVERSGGERADTTPSDGGWGVDLELQVSHGAASENRTPDNLITRAAGGCPWQYARVHRPRSAGPSAYEQPAVDGQERPWTDRNGNQRGTNWRPTGTVQVPSAACWLRTGRRRIHRWPVNRSRSTAIALTVFADLSKYRPDVAEGLGAAVGSPAAADLLLELGHRYVAFGSVANRST